MTVMAVLLVAVMCVGGYVLAGEAAVVALVLAAVGSLAWRVAVASRPRPLRGGARRRSPGDAASGVRIGHQRDAHVVRDEGGQREGVEHLMEAEPPR